MAYSFKQYDKERMARSSGRAISISTKQSIEVCSRIRGKSLRVAKRLLDDAASLKKPITFTRFTGDHGHKKKQGPARYAKKTCQEMMKLLESAESNAQFKGLNTKGLVVAYIKADKAGNSWHYGRKRRRAMKRTNIELVLEEKKAPEKEKKKQDASKTKAENKPKKGAQ